MTNNAYDDRLKKLGEAIRARRVEQGLSQRKLAQMIGQTGHAYIFRVEKGLIPLGVEQVFKIADALDIKVKDLFDFDKLV